MVRGSQRRGDSVSIVLRVRCKEKIKRVCCMVMTIRNTCGMFDNLFQLVRNREMKRLNSPNISMGGFEPVSVMYIEVSNIENFSAWVWRQQRLMARRKILKEGGKVGSIRGAVAKAKKDSSCRKVYETNLECDLQYSSWNYFGLWSTCREPTSACDLQPKGRSSGNGLERSGLGRWIKKGLDMKILKSFKGGSSSVFHSVILLFSF